MKIDRCPSCPSLPVRLKEYPRIVGIPGRSFVVAERHRQIGHLDKIWRCAWCNCQFDEQGYKEMLEFKITGKRK